MQAMLVSTALELFGKARLESFSLYCYRFRQAMNMLAGRPALGGEPFRRCRRPGLDAGRDARAPSGTDRFYPIQVSLTFNRELDRQDKAACLPL